MFGRWARTQLYEEIIKATGKFLHVELNKEKNIFDSMYNMERKRLLVLDSEEDSFNEADILSELSANSASWRAEYRINDLRSHGHNVKEQDERSIREGARMQPDPYDAELRALAVCRPHEQFLIDC